MREALQLPEREVRYGENRLLLANVVELRELELEVSLLLTSELELRATV
jgi:hypothetical protein